MVEVELNITDYKVLMGWYEIAFASKDKVADVDKELMNKLCIMAKAYIEELKDVEKEED